MRLSVMERACAATDQIVSELTPADFGEPTPCTEWDVRALLNHVVGTLWLGAALLGDTAPAVNMGPGGLPDAELVGSEPGMAYRDGVQALLEAAGGDALDRIHRTPLGDMPGVVLAGFTALDIAVHGWDLANATGQSFGLDDDVAEEILGFARQTIGDGMRGSRIGPEVTVAPGAPAIDRLVAYLGRTP